MFYKLIREKSLSGASGIRPKEVRGKLYRVSHYTNKRTGEFAKPLFVSLSPVLRQRHRESRYVVQRPRRTFFYKKMQKICIFQKNVVPLRRKVRKRHF